MYVAGELVYIYIYIYIYIYTTQTDTYLCFLALALLNMIVPMFVEWVTKCSPHSGAWYRYAPIFCDGRAATGNSIYNQVIM